MSSITNPLYASTATFRGGTETAEGRADCAGLIEDGCVKMVADMSPLFENSLKPRAAGDDER
jgi:hypothetical protein